MSPEDGAEDVAGEEAVAAAALELAVEEGTTAALAPTATIELDAPPAAAAVAIEKSTAKGRTKRMVGVE